FFFQAEDGIRAFHVTGVQTCALPISTHLCLALGADSPCADERCAGNLGLTARGLFTLFIATHVSIRTSDTSSNPLGSPSQAYRRSEERRVGKECMCSVLADACSVKME